MCGIAGIVALDGSGLSPEHEALVARMNEAQAHRGPDDRGVALLGHACLGTVRLSILDLSPAGHMPMSDADGARFLAYNGEVYNYRELRTELEGLGHAFRSETDTEVVLHAFMEWGEAALERLNGMFGFALLDRRSGALTLVRDRLGIKPLYVYTGDELPGRLAFASEIKALRVAVPDLELDERALLEWSLHQSVDAPSPGTLYRGVRSLLPGELLRLVPHDAAGTLALERSRYYDPAERIDRPRWERLSAASATEVAHEVERTLHAAVEDRLVSDVPVGTLLSGGLDSSLITGVAAQRREVTAFHVSVTGPGELSERPKAEYVAKRFGVELVPLEFTASDFRRGLPRAIALSDLPLTHANSVAYGAICRKAREHGVIVLLSGEGADELFGGYAWRYRRQRFLQRAANLLERLPPRVRTAVQLVGAASGRLPVDLRRFEQLLPQAVGMLDGFERRAQRERCEAAYGFVDGAHDRGLLGAMLADLSDFLTPLLRRLDRMSMGASVECRVPFLDHRFVELAMHLPLEHRVGRHADKWALKQVAERYYPSGNLIRRSMTRERKMGFPLPLAHYLAPFAEEAFFRGGFWTEVFGLQMTGIRDAMARRTSDPFAFLALVSGELWGRMAFLGQSCEALTEEVVELEKRHGG